MENEKINIWWLFIGGTVLLTAGWLMRVFPIFMFVGLAPFFAILDHTIESENFWENTEMILLGLALSFFAAFWFAGDSVVTVLIHAIVFTLPFLGFAFAHEHLGARTGKFIVIFIWLGLEYALLKLQWPSNSLFLADSLSSWPNWLRWNGHTGYLGATAWILISNWIIYAGTLRTGLNWPIIFLGLAVIVGPMAYSYSLEAKPILRQVMVEHYSSATVTNQDYAAEGELVARTCAWISILLLLFAGVKAKIS